MNLAGTGYVACDGCIARQEAAMRGVRVLYVCGVLVAVAAVAGSQATATSGSAGSLAVGRVGRPITVTVEMPGGVGGVTSQMLVVGRPGSTPEVGPHQEQLPATSVDRVANQLDATTSFTYTSLSARLSPTAPGTYPVFLFSSRELGCGSANMDDPPDLTITRVGQVQVW
jgi:hypothetical protein